MAGDSLHRTAKKMLSSHGSFERGSIYNSNCNNLIDVKSGQIN